MYGLQSTSSSPGSSARGRDESASTDYSEAADDDIVDAEFDRA
jgi:hypothetical protein